MVNDNSASLEHAERFLGLVPYFWTHLVEEGLRKKVYNRAE